MGTQLYQEYIFIHTTSWEPSFIRKLNFSYKSQPTQLKTKLLEHSHGSTDLSYQNLKQIGQRVHEL